jgi:hypothetical protein
MFDRRRLEIRMGARSKAAAREGDNPAAVPCRIERQHEVNHGEAGADEQRSPAARSQFSYCRTGIIAPRIANETAPDTVKGAQRLRLLVADGKDQRLSVDRRPVVERHMPSRLIAVTGNGRCLSRLGAAAPDRLLKDLTEIPRKKAPLSEAAPITALGFERPREMVGLTRERAHALRADVEQVRLLGRRVSDSPAHAAAAVDQRRADAAPRELRREDGSRCSAADNCDRRPAVRFRSQANSPDLPRRLCGGPYDRTCR